MLIEKKGAPIGVISFHHRSIALKGKVVDFIWVFCSVLVIELWRGLLLVLTSTHQVLRGMNPLIYCISPVKKTRGGCGEGSKRKRLYEIQLMRLSHLFHLPRRSCHGSELRNDLP